MPKISIIVPVYNVECYVEDCIKSILNQTFKDFELILVNDGSTDKSRYICEKYAQKDNRIKVINKANGGQADARNVGINLAMGKYVGFIDSDDTIDSTMFETLYNLCEYNDADISTCRLKLIKMDDNEKYDKQYTNSIQLLTNKEAIKLTYDGKLSGYSPCNKLYKSELFNEIKFPKGRIYEDASVLYKLYMKSNRIVFIDKPLYNYIRRVGSTTNRPFSQSRLDIVDMFKEKYDFMNDNYPEMCEKIKSMYYDSLRNIIVDIVNENTVEKNYSSIKIVSKTIRKELKHILNNNLITNGHKVLAIILAYTPIIAIRLYKIKIRKIDESLKETELQSGV